jgi:hypothetical protein
MSMLAQRTAPHVPASKLASRDARDGRGCPLQLTAPQGRVRSSGHESTLGNVCYETENPDRSGRYYSPSAWADAPANHTEASCAARPATPTSAMQTRWSLASRPAASSIRWRAVRRARRRSEAARRSVGRQAARTQAGRTHPKTDFGAYWVVPDRTKHIFLGHELIHARHIAAGDADTGARRRSVRYQGRGDHDRDRQAQRERPARRARHDQAPRPRRLGHVIT